MSVTGEAPLAKAIRADHARLRGPGAGLMRLCLDGVLHKTFRCILSYRLYRAARRSPRWRALAAVAALWHRWTSLAIKAEIAWQAEIGPGLRMLHGFGVVILPCARIGAGVTLAHGAIVGYRPDARSGQPRGAGVVGDGCFIGPYAMVWAELGEGATLASHSVLIRSGGPGEVMIGAPAEPLRRRAAAAAPV